MSCHGMTLQHSLISVGPRHGVADYGFPTATGNIFPLKNLCPFRAKPEINSAICLASTGAL